MRLSGRIAILTVIVGLVGVASIVLIPNLLDRPAAPHLLPAPQVAHAGGTRTGDTVVGTGWSTLEDPVEAAEKTLDMALAGQPTGSADFVILFATAGSDAAAILKTARQRLGPATKIYGGTADSRGVMTEKGFLQVSDRGYAATMQGRRGLAALAVTSHRIHVGVGSANYAEFHTVREAGKAAVTRALASAGRAPGEMPQVVLTTPTIGEEEEMLAGMEDVVGRSTVILGGTTGGPAMSVFGETGVYERGVSVAVFYTDLAVGWTFEGGFDVTDPHSGIVTRTEGQAIIEIDGRPALTVYDEWLGGRISQLFAENAPFDRFRDLLTLCPIYRKVTSPEGEEYQLFSHPWPRDPTGQDKAIMTSTHVVPGERIFLSRGTWETLLNRVGSMPRRAKVRGELGVAARPLFGVGVVCGGVMGVIPEAERQKMPALINSADGGAPFIATFTWGEQGHFSGGGNRHGNLTCSFLIFGEKD